MRSRWLSFGTLLVLTSVVGCSNDGDETSGSNGSSDGVESGVVEADDDLQALAVALRDAATAVDAELGAPQSFFELTATPKLTNVFVAIDEATAAVPYVFIDGVLEPPAPTIDGVTGYTFEADALTFDETVLLGRIADELPSAIIESVSVEGGPGGAVRYVVSARSDDGGLLEVIVGPTGAILSADPV